MRCLSAAAAYNGGSQSGDYSTSYSYDANSNLTGITRRAIEGFPGDNAFMPGGTIYALDGNQVTVRLQGGSGAFRPLMNNAVVTDFRQVYYDACGRMVCDSDRGINKIEYNALYLPSTIEYATDGNSLTGYSYGVQYAADGRKLRTGRLDQATKRLQNATVTDYPEEEELVSVELESLIPSGERIPVLRFESPTDYVGNLVYKDGVLEKILIDGGFITAADGRYHFFVTDHLGNVRVVVNDASVIEQVNQFYPYGESIELDPASANPGVETITENPYKWGGKKWDEEQGAYDFGARMYSAADARWTTMDPLSEKYYHISPYAYCAGNPVNLVDPEGREVWVVNRDGVYEIIGGALNNDLNIYVYLPDEDGNYTVRGESIGQTATAYSFYDSDTGEWAEGSIIDPNDNSGKDFLASMKGVSVIEYMDKARTNHEWDFKVTNGTDVVIDKSKRYTFRGMPIETSSDGQTVYASARDIGNIAAGYVAGSNGLSWELTRLGCDVYQSYVTSKAKHALRFDMEGATTKSAQYYGWLKSGRAAWGKSLPH